MKMNKKKHQRDPRINAYSLKPQEYLLVLLLCNALCASLIRIYTRIHASLSRSSLEASIWETPTLLFGVGGYVLFVSVVLSMIFVGWRRFNLSRKVGVLSDAARRVAEGDYSVRIAPQRDDGKKDEFEVLYDDFNSMAHLLEGKTILREDFLSNVSHEFRTPLSVINNYVTVLQSDTLTKEERDIILERIRLSSEQLSGMVGNVLQISRLENNNIRPEKKVFDLSEQLVQTILSYDQALEEKNIEMEVDFDDGVMVRSDDGLLQMVWNNLMSNAIKFTPEGGTIAIRIDQKPEGVCVMVRDTGCGISPENQNRIFEKFYQADRFHSIRSNGLGLSLVKNICDLLGCSITLESALGEGSEFRVLIPEDIGIGE